MKFAHLILAPLLFAGLTLNGPAQAQSKDPITQGLLKIAQPYVQQLNQTASKDPALKKRLEVFGQESRKILNDKTLKLKERDAALNRLAQQNLKLMREWFLKARVDEAKYQTDAQRFFKGYEVRAKKRYNVQYKGFLSYTWKFVPRRFVPTFGDKEILITPPYAYEDHHMNGMGEWGIDLDDGRYNISASTLVAGGFENSIGIGHFLIIDDNYDDIEVSVALPEVNYYISAASELLGAAGSSIKAHIEVLANNQIVCEEEVLEASVLAPALWLASAEGSDNVVVGCEFNAPERGDEIVVRFGETPGSWAVGLAGGGASGWGIVRDMRIRLKR